jgi:hypothetical protein
MRPDGFVTGEAPVRPASTRELTQVLDAIVGAQHVDFAVTHSTAE